MKDLGGSFIQTQVLDVFDAGDMFVGALENGWNGAGECVKPHRAFRLLRSAPVS